MKIPVKVYENINPTDVNVGDINLVESDSFLDWDGDYLYLVSEL